jgi:hypothetical protein
LEGIRLHKVNFHRSSDKRSVLVLTEILEFESFLRKPKGAGNSWVIRACCDDLISGSDADNHRRWFTASIESVRANEILAQNATLELGEEAGWTPKSFAMASILDDFCIPACGMLKQMDGVGYHNNNGIRRSTATAGPAPPPKPEYQFW